MPSRSLDTATADVLSTIRVHDVDTHISEPYDLWTSRVPRKWGDAVPHVREVPASVPRPADEFLAWIDAQPCWFTGARKITQATGGVPPGDFDPETIAGRSDPRSRLAWMDRHGIHSQILYPNVLGFFVTAFLEMEPELGIACVKAYNDFQTEFASVDPERLVPIMNLPWWDMDAALAELDRCHAMGHKGLNLGWEFEKVGHPRLRDDYWEPLLKSAEERGLPVSFHIGFNSDAVQTALGMTVTSKLDVATFAAKLFTGNIHCIAELIMGRICERYPRLNFVSVESGCGFIPYLLDALDWQFLNGNAYRDYPTMLLPSEYFRRQIYGTFWFEKDIARFADLYPDNFMFESDYPHTTSLTPGDEYPFVKGPRDTIVAHLGGLGEELLRKVLQENAARVYGLA
jgi:predicted TIM-barrel fold metal-dependent hydrolase